MMKKRLHKRKRTKRKSPTNKKNSNYEAELVETLKVEATHKRRKLAVNKAKQVKMIRGIYRNGDLNKYGLLQIRDMLFPKLQITWPALNIVEEDKQKTKKLSNIARKSIE